MNQLLAQYCYLQTLDFLTTLAFLTTGVKEANPLVRAAMQVGTNPAGGLLLVKVAAVLLGFYAWRMGRQRLLNRANTFFALLVVWNLVALVLGHFSA
jgi:hypothetical protein